MTTWHETYEEQVVPAINTISTGRQELGDVPGLETHRGAGPDLILRWNDMPQVTSLDVVVHFHGFSGHGNRMNLVRDKEAISGLDWSNPQATNSSQGRTRATLGLMPRGHFYGGCSGAGYNFPALVQTGRLQALIRWSLEHFAISHGIQTPSINRLILSAHSGGGAALLQVLSELNPHEVHLFDALYQSPERLLAWLTRRLEHDRAGLGNTDLAAFMTEQGSAMRVLYTSGGGTARNSLTLQRQLERSLTEQPTLRPWYRVERTTTTHNEVPRMYGWRLLGNVSSDLPNIAGAPRSHDSENASEDHPNIQRGSQGAPVREAQHKLNQVHALELLNGRPGLRDAPLVEDGDFGSKTHNATISFQQLVFPNQPAQHDGMIGPRTWAQLDARVETPSLPVIPVIPTPSTPVVVPSFNTNPSHWFLSDAEIAASRGGHRRSLNAFSSGNLVEPLIDGEEMMTALAADISRCGTNDTLHFTGWQLESHFNLRPGTSPAAASTVLGLWSAAKRRGTNCRVLLWRNNLSTNIPTAVDLQTVGVEAVIDARFPKFGSHHQKTAVVIHRGEIIAYCGGIDLASDRWDTRRHDNDPRRVKAKWFAWHDVHARVQGAAAIDIERNFRERWNDPSWPSIWPVPTAGSIIPRPVQPPPPITNPLPAARVVGSHHVQVLRNFACANNEYPSFAPAGELSAMQGYLKAIARAQRYIYIEDQYLVFDEIAQALERALTRIEKLIIVVPKENDNPVIPIVCNVKSTFNWHQANFLRIVRLRYPNKVHVYHPVQPSGGEPIYVHAKMMIIDDIYAVIGSVNMGRRSMTYDTEIAVAVIDDHIESGVCRFAHDLRLNLWSEHLGIPRSASSIADPIVGVNEWERQASAGTFRMRHHIVPSPQDEQPFCWNVGADPDGRCPTETFIA
jgi:phosphatidylserine/phosphatidylglycerophosphate/cardiolipin synthase-like enzyme/peptidoglycan hydrolase-like protein with peptidoglycan-binding domain